MRTWSDPPGHIVSVPPWRVSTDHDIGTSAMRGTRKHLPDEVTVLFGTVRVPVTFLISARIVTVLVTQYSLSKGSQSKVRYGMV